MKRYLSNPLLISPSKGGEKLLLYLMASNTIMSATLIREENRVQLPVYYVSQVFHGAKAEYPRMEKIFFSLIIASHKLRPYFQENPILVMID